MPKAKIVIEDSNLRKTLNSLINEEIIKVHTIKGKRVFTRFYLTREQAKNAYERSQR